MLELLVNSLPSTSAVTIKRLHSLNIHTYADLLYHFPHRYEDRRVVRPIYGLQVDDHVCIEGVIEEIKTEQTKRFMKLQKAQIADDTGKIEVVWFNQPYIAQMLKPGMRICVWGVCRIFGRTRSFTPLEFEIVQTGIATKHTKQIIPIYPETYGLSSKTIREKVRYVLTCLATDTEAAAVLGILPETIENEYSLLPIEKALTLIHTPNTEQDIAQARRRLGFDELFVIQTRSHLVKQEWEQQVCRPYILGSYEKEVKQLLDSLSFELTPSQSVAFDEVARDLGQPICMNRFLQGDVGSGKTIIAALAAYIVHLHGDKTLIMAPTEILAQQHFATLSKVFENTSVRVGLQTKSSKVSHAKKGVSSGDYDIIVGTHALLNEQYEGTIGFIVIDEQHRFGVKQRADLKTKGMHPHLLTMTATPIPRTAALAMFGELDMSILTELPKNRLPIKTYLVEPGKRQDAYAWIKKQIESGDQAYIICPLVEDSDHETMKDVKAATVEHERLAREVFPTLRLGLLHGKMKPADKQRVMEEFRNHDFDILVATSVVEVGIDVANATIIVIEAAERFGLAALHQLRGRVGRGQKQSYCLLFPTDQQSYPSQRLAYFTKHNLGIDIAQYDMKLRGVGDLYGTMQHGELSLKIANLGDYELIAQVQSAAKTYLQTNTVSDNKPLVERLKHEEVAQVAHD